MKRISELLSSIRPIRLVLSSILCAVLFFAGGCSTLAAKTTAPASPEEGTAQLDDIGIKSQQAIDNPQGVNKSEKRGINEVQGSANRDKMIRSDRSESPAVEKVEEVLSNIKKS